MSKLIDWLEQNTQPKISAKELAQKLKVDGSLITLWRQGKRKPGKDKLKPLSKLTGIALEDLI